PFPFAREGIKHLGSAIMLVELDDKSAVLWTRPDVWQYDPRHPLDGIAQTRLGHRGSLLKGSTMVFWDGHYQFLTADANPDQVRALFRGDRYEPQSVSLSWR